MLNRDRWLGDSPNERWDMRLLVFCVTVLAVLAIGRVLGIQFLLWKWWFLCVFWLFLLIGAVKAQAPSRCPNGQWKCANGDCIESANHCDGTPNCADKSDETATVCIANTCPKYSFRCAYGACIKGIAECDGRKDCADNSDELSARCPPRHLAAPRGNCNVSEYQCTNGKCIDDADVCDGAYNCDDGSDETVERCASIYCPAYAFRCGYGGCANGRSKCNGVIDCVDGSDENQVLCNYTKPLTLPLPTHRPVTVTTTTTPAPQPLAPDACRITTIPKNGFIAYPSDPSEHIALNEVIENYGMIEYSCIDNHNVVGNTTNLCLDGHWLWSVPVCQPFCSGREISSVTYVANCYVNEGNREKQVRCTEPSAPGTIARINCQRGYENQKVPQQVISCGNDGRWRPAPNTCTQLCGEEGPEGSPYIVGGIVTNITKVPWHVAVYKRSDKSFEQWCGGTILNAKVVISAMHCFWDRLEDKPFSVGEFRIVAGKFKRDYNADENLKTQIFSVDKIHYVDGYSDITGLYASDIAILVLNTFIEFKTHISPICMDYDLTFDDRTVPAGWTGRVAGWGLEANNGQPSPLLKVIELPAVSRAECRANSSREFLPYITSDKFCAGYLTGISVCQVILHRN